MDVGIGMGITAIAIIAVGGILYHNRNTAKKVLHEYKLRHPEKYGPQLDSPTRHRSWFRHSPVPPMIEVNTRPGRVASGEDGPWMALAGNREKLDDMIPLRDEDFGAAYGEDQKAQDARLEGRISS